jgi:GT2 family glycosyltransferase
MAEQPASPDTERPIASVILLGWNRRHFIDDCLSSVLDQDFERPYEVIFVDNGSVDGSPAYVRERFPTVRVIENGRNEGYAGGNNIGYGQARGDYAVFLNDDTVVHRSWLRQLVDAVESSLDIGAAHANVIQPWYPEYAGIGIRAQAGTGYTSEVNRWGYIAYKKLPSTDRLYDTIFLHGVCIILRRSVADRLGYIFDPDFFAYAEDLDLGLRVRALGYRCVAVPKAVVYHKHTLQTSLSPYTVVKTVRIIRNRYLAFYKVMSGWEFALMLPVMTVGAPFNALEFGLGGVRRVLYGLALVPATAAALIVTLVQLRKFSAKRRQVRDQAARRDAWCLRALWRPALEGASKA